MRALLTSAIAGLMLDHPGHLRRIFSETLRPTSGPVYAGLVLDAAPTSRWRVVADPLVVIRNAETGIFHHVEGPDAFTTWHEADEASRFLRADG
jgi:hypothetical protein